MIPASLAHALEFFKTQAPTEISRDAVMAYATLRAVEHYYPNMLEMPMKQLLDEYSWIKAQEPARAIKQKRIMSWVISRELNGWSGSGTTETTEPTARLIYELRWKKNKVDISELVTLRNQGLKWREIAARMGICRTTAKRAYRAHLKR